LGDPDAYPAKRISGRAERGIENHLLFRIVKSKRVYIEFSKQCARLRSLFEMAYRSGQIATGFISFGFDFNTTLEIGGATNVLAVMADNRFTSKRTWPKSRSRNCPGTVALASCARGNLPPRLSACNGSAPITLPLYSNLKTVGPYIYFCIGISKKAGADFLRVPVKSEAAR